MAEITSLGKGTPLIAVSEDHLRQWAAEINKRLEDAEGFIGNENEAWGLRSNTAMGIVDTFFAEMIQTGFRS